jgi:hypothetical protein
MIVSDLRRTLNTIEDTYYHIQSNTEELNVVQSSDMVAPSDISLGSAEELLESNMSTTTPDVQQEIVNFSDQVSGENLDLSTVVDYTKGDDSQSIELNNFMMRPVKIFSTTWTEGTSLGNNEFYPWHLYFNNAQIKRKLDNYYLLRANLKLKIVINASPFYYGAGYLAYQPLFAFEQNWDYATNPDYFDSTLITQKPIVYFYPQDNCGAEISLPWCYHKEWIDATSSTDLQQMGKCFLSSLSNLRNANSVVGAAVQVTVYAWATDIKLAGPTQEYAVQSSDRDEYDGFISKPASAIARAAGCLEEVPIIGPFATATSSIVGTIGNIASLFGFSRVPTNEDTHPYRSKTHPNLANSDIKEVIDKLTFDSKNELSIDPKICGVPLSDEMDITSFVKRPALLTTATWTAANVTGDFLKIIRVSPNMQNAVARTSEHFVTFTPMAYVAQMFEYWRGDIIITLKVISSQYHKGRLEILWDPRSKLDVLTDTSMVNYTHILDISEQTEIKFRVPYTQATAYSSTDNDITSTVHSTSPFTPILNQDNGTFGIKVLNPQTSPVASADIDILIYVNGDDNLEFGGPINISNQFSPYQVQSSDKQVNDIREETTMVDIGIKSSEAFKEINLVYHGESIKSFRTLMQRMVDYTIIQHIGTNSGNLIGLQFIMPRALMYPGYVPSGGMHLANPLVGVGNKSYNFISWHASNWLSLAYIGNRGSTVYTVSTVESNFFVDISRWTTSTMPVVTPYSLVSTSNNQTARSLVADSVSMAGKTCTNGATQTTVSVGIPLYSKYKMLSNNPNIRNVGSSIDGSNSDGLYVKSYKSNTFGSNTTHGVLQIQAGVGVDFSLVFFSGIQPMYYYASLPTGV